MYNDFEPEQMERAEELLFDKPKGIIKAEVYKRQKNEYFVEVQFASRNQILRTCSIRLHITDRKMQLPFMKEGELAYFSLTDWDNLLEADKVEIPYRDARISLDNYGQLYITVILEGNGMELSLDVDTFAEDAINEHR